MDLPLGSGAPSILQLHKWGPSHPQLNLSEFREAFISPTRQLLLLLSNQCEALLLPLATGDSRVSNEEKNDETLHCSGSGAFSSQALSLPSELDSRMDDLPCTSGLAVDFDGSSSFGSEISRFKSYPFVADVNSLAWGVCGDTYNLHEDSLFREFLFVSGNHGVTVHAFCKPYRNTATTRIESEGEFGHGNWVEWGPSATLVQNMEVEKATSSFHDTHRNVEDLKMANGNSETPDNVSSMGGNNEFARGVSSKRWLQSFCTKVEDIETDGKVWTRFPEKSSFPCSARVVSFNIFSNFPFMEFLPLSNSLSNKENLQERVHDSVGDPSTNLEFPSSGLNLRPKILSSTFGVGMDSLYKCSRVFSSTSHNFVGFVLTLKDPVPINNSDGSERSMHKNIVLVARLDSWGIQWVSSIKLEESLNTDLLVEWTDFCFSENLLICLNSCGLIVFYSATSGECVIHLDILWTCGIKPQSGFLENNKFSVSADRKSIQVNLVHDRLVYQYGDCLGRKNFNKLITASHTSLLAVVDDNGVVYVICAGDYLGKEHHKYELLPHCQHLGLGMFVGWEVGGFDISCQRVYSDFDGYSNSNASSTGIPFWNNSGDSSFIKFQEAKLHGKGKQYSCLSGFSAASETNKVFHGVDAKSHLMRKIFLPTYKFSEDDSIFFSPFGITRLMRKHNLKDQKGSQIVHFNLHGESAVRDDSCLNSACEMFYLQGMETFIGDAVACTFQGCFYLVTEGGLSVVLPSLSLSSNFFPVESIGYRQSSINSCTEYQLNHSLELKYSKQPWLPWNIEVLDRVLLYESTEEADRLCLENGWDLKTSHIRRLQLALDYLKFDEIEQSLEMLVGVNLAEEGILRLLFAAVYLMFSKVGSENDISASSRLLALATRFATKMIRKYGLLQYDSFSQVSQSFIRRQILALPSVLPEKVQSEVGNSRRLHEMAHFLEIIRNLQSRLNSKFKRPGRGLVDGGEPSRLVDTDLLQDEPELSIASADTLSLEKSEHHEVSFPVSAVGSSYAGNLDLTPVDPKASFDPEVLSEVSAFVPQGGLLEKKILPLENPKEMFARWKIDNLDLKTVVHDALLSGRLPLAVLQLHLHRSRDLVSDKEPHDTFMEVRDIGRAIAYDLFLKGEIGLAVATLQRLGEDVENSLKQLLFGTVRRSLRAQLTEEMKRYGYLVPYELKILDKIALIESLYPNSSFWKTFVGRQKEYARVPAGLNSQRRYYLRLLHSHVINNFSIECNEIDGVVLGSWANVNESPSVTVVDDDNPHYGYWAAAAVWASDWDQRTIDRIVLDQSSFVGDHVLWESQLEYHICRNDWEAVSTLLDLIPEPILVDGSLQVSLDGLNPTTIVGCDGESSNYGNYLCSLEELDAVCMDVRDVKILRFPAIIMGSMWLKMLMEEKLARKFIFVKEFWEGTAEIVPLLARSGFITSKYKIPANDDSVESLSDMKSLDGGETFYPYTIQSLHKLLLRHCVQGNLPYLLDLYLDYHDLVVHKDSLCSLQDAAGDCEWAKWLLLSRVKGCEYDASFSNARSITSQGLVPTANLGVHDMDEVIRTVDDIAEGGGELAALATLMYAPAPIQNCLSSGSIKRHSSSSAQCTLENLKPTLQRFHTLWRTFVSACFGQDTTYSYFGPRAKNALSDYLNWRDNVFFSTGRDTSFLQMLPCWFPKAVRRLIQLYVQGPLGWQSIPRMPIGETLLRRDIDFFINVDEHAEISAVSWEATIQKHIEEELYDPALEDTGLGLEHHLHRGRALSAFKRLLTVRVQKLTSEGQSGAATNGQTNTQSDVLTLLAPITESEESLLSSVIPLAIMHFEDSVLVASCAFLLELCGLSASMLRVDIAALRRISAYYKASENNENARQLSPNSSAFHAASREVDVIESLARALADEYLHQDIASIAKKKVIPGKEILSSFSGRQSSRALMLVLQHLEKVSLPVMVDGKTCGSWLLSGNGDGIELRSQQKAASQHWNLVTMFCQMHQLPLSTKYLAVLARDNDWVGYLSEAQVGGYPFDVVVQVASKEFSDPRLRVHILTVLKGMQSRKKASSSSYSDSTEKRTDMCFPDEDICIPVELFRILAECEKQKNPGEALLMKAKDLSWSILAMIASCFSDVSPLSCLTVWLEITAARETSSIKVNDIASQIADNVGAAVEACNSLPAGSRTLTFHYNRRNPKRRRLMEPIAVDSSPAIISDIPSGPLGEKVLFSQSTIGEDERRVEVNEGHNVYTDSDEGPISLTKMVAVLCEQLLFLPLLRAFEMFLPSCSLLSFIRALQAFSQMRLSEASAHLGSFSVRIKEEPGHLQANIGREGQIGTTWISSTAVKAADAMLSTCPSPYEKRCLLQLLAATDFGDGGSAATYYRRLYWKINLAEPSLRKDDVLHLGNETLDDASLLTALEKNSHWEQGRNWAKHLEASGEPWKSAVHHVTENQAESMVAEWKEFLWDVPEERVALWGHCQTLFIRYAFPALQAGLFFLKHAEAVEKDLPARELHELLLLSLQWLSGMITLSNPVYPLHLLREIETKVWLLAVESEAQVKNEGEFNSISSIRDPITKISSNIIDRTASIITKMDNHINTIRNRTFEKYDMRDINQAHYKNQLDASYSTTAGGNIKAKRRAKGYATLRRPLLDPADKTADSDEVSSSVNCKNDTQLQDENIKMEMSFSRWEERVGSAELERAVLSLLEFGQITAAKQLQHKLSPALIPSEFVLVDVALKLARISTPGGLVSISILDEDVRSVMQSQKILSYQHQVEPMQVLESLAAIFTEGSGRGLCKRIIAVVKAANMLGLSFSEAFEKQPIELLQLLSLKAQESFEEANLLVQTHSMPAASIAQILAESFLKGLLAAHRGGYMDSQKEEGPAPLLWRFSDFLKWAELCPSEPEIGHALMRMVITGQEIPHACEVELLILSHHFYKSSACLDGVDVLVALAATRVEAYVSEGDFPCLARLITGVGNFHALNFILGILIENGQLDLLLQKYSAAADTNASTAEAVRGFRMAVLTSLKHFNSNDLDAFAMVYNHFDMKHETASLLEARAIQSSEQWFSRNDKEQNEDLLDSMRHFIEAAEVHSSIDAGNKTRRACAQASLLSLQIRMPDFRWLYQSETNARRALVEQSRFQEALIVAEAYGLNQPSEWALVLWNQMLKPELLEEFVAEFVAVLPLQPSMLVDLAKFYRAEMAARGDQSQFSVWLTGGGLPAEWAKYLGRSFRCLLKRTRDLRLRMQLASMATGFNDVIDSCSKALDKVPDNAGPLVLRKGHGGAYLPLM
ncbi:hypothetical protein FNV43_RR18768 [Rhamnella rubrinervis]|uniref:Spatacsin C-terminal domain-containing protein n=1 Tax=Rhamnella rubrinervis TaxID=2594499 RepID=A0A8K0GVY4_9ROSA|nr:hypothetical protein FNV43_RR18768 [Rhamnella rubrinervis]